MDKELRKLNYTIGYADGMVLDVIQRIQSALATPGLSEPFLRSALRNLEACRAEIAKTNPDAINALAKQRETTDA